MKRYLREFQAEEGYIAFRRRPADTPTFLCMLRAQEFGNPTAPPRPRRADSGWDHTTTTSEAPTQENENDTQLEVPELALAGLDATVGSATDEKDTSMNKKRVDADGYLDPWKRLSVPHFRVEGFN